MSLDGARAAYRRQDWVAARDGFLQARSRNELSPDDLNALTDAAWWAGDIDVVLEVGEETYRRFLQGDRVADASMTALGLAYSLFLRGDDIAASGWLSRARRLLRDEPERAEHGYLLYLEVEGALDAGDADATIAAAARVAEIGRRHGDPNLVLAAMTATGRALVRQGHLDEGMALLDEAGLSVSAPDLTPEWAGNVYCHLVAACVEIVDVRRAATWTEALGAWCQGRSPATLFTGICRVHRAQIAQRRGAWDRAEAELLIVCDELEAISTATVAEAHVAIGDLRRQRGDLELAGKAYSAAQVLGRDPQPGRSLLHLALGHAAEALASIDAAVLHTADPLRRAALLAAQVEIVLTAGAHDTGEAAQRATAAVDELEEIASRWPTSGLVAMSRSARGRLLLELGSTEEALVHLGEARRRWLEVAATYDVALMAESIGAAYRAVGDETSARTELEAAARTYDELGAVPAATRVADMLERRTLPGGLSRREAEVLTLVATGMSNVAVADRLFISRKTVARHLSNIFTKIGASSRTEAAAWAFGHGLAPPTADGSDDPPAR